MRWSMGLVVVEQRRDVAKPVRSSSSISLSQCQFAALSSLISGFSINGMRRTSGFSMVELLAVVAIIAVLIGFLLPVVQQAREAARRSQCANNLHQLATAMHNYESIYSCFPPGSVGPMIDNSLFPKGWCDPLLGSGMPWGNFGWP